MTDKRLSAVDTLLKTTNDTRDAIAELSAKLERLVALDKITREAEQTAGILERGGCRNVR